MEGEAGALVLRASSSSVISPGFLSVYSSHALKQRAEGDDGTDADAEGDDGGAGGAEGGEDAAAVEWWSGRPQAGGAVIASIQVIHRTVSTGIRSRA